MPTPTPTEIARRALTEHLVALPTAELLVRDAARRDPEAFAGLVRQFGPMALGVCYGVLDRSPDADSVWVRTTGLLMRRLAPMALVVSLIALSLSVWNWQQAEIRARQSEERAEERAKLVVETAIRRHEEATVEKSRQALAKVCGEFGLRYPDSPRSVADILAVLFKLLEGLSR